MARRVVCPRCGREGRIHYVRVGARYYKHILHECYIGPVSQEEAKRLARRRRGSRG